MKTHALLWAPQSLNPGKMQWKSQNSSHLPSHFVLVCGRKCTYLGASWVKAEKSVANSWQRGFISKWRMDSRAPEPLGWHMVVSWHRTRVLGLGDGLKVTGLLLCTARCLTFAGVFLTASCPLSKQGWPAISVSIARGRKTTRNYLPLRSLLRPSTPGRRADALST